MNSVGELGQRDARRHFPRFQGPNFQKNVQLATRFKEFAAKKGVSSAQLAIAWVVAQGEDIVSLLGVKTRTHLDDSVAADQVRLSPRELEELETMLPKNVAAGLRYPAPAMIALNG